MGGGKAERIEAVIDRLGAALFGGAAAYASFRLLSGSYGEPQLGVFSAGAAAVGYLGCARILRSVKPEDHRFAVVPFEVAPILHLQADELLLAEEVELLLTEGAELLLTDQVELVLTDADRLRSSETPAREELVLDDILAQLGPGSRVVRLFDPAAMPTPGQLNARIERHFDEATSPAAPPDASQALYDALAELKRSLR